MAQLILSGSYTFNGKVWGRISKQAKDLINKMLTIDPEERVSIDQVLSHEWINKVKFSKVFHRTINQFRIIRIYCYSTKSRDYWITFQKVVAVHLFLAALILMIVSRQRNDYFCRITMRLPQGWIRGHECPQIPVFVVFYMCSCFFFYFRYVQYLNICIFFDCFDISTDVCVFLYKYFVFTTYKFIVL